MTWDPAQIRELYLRAKTVLGPEVCQCLADSKHRFDAFNVAMSRAIKAMGGPDKVTDEQILGALEIAHEVWPIELEAIAKAFCRDEEGRGA